jgi:hypothetical protein
VIDFAKQHFTENSVFVNTDKGQWKSLGTFDLSHEKKGYNPKQQASNQSKQVQYRKVKENLFYFTTMCKSKFILCPAGDSAWSFRFYETLMCKSMPIVESWHHTYRTKEESEIPFQYVLFNQHLLFLNEKVEKNTELFEKYHLL